MEAELGGGLGSGAAWEDGSPELGLWSSGFLPFPLFKLRASSLFFQIFGGVDGGLWGAVG